MLEELHVGVNELTGKIPPQLGDLANLRDMDLSANRLEGELPSELGKLGNLVVLDIVSNQLSGGVPAELGNLTRVEELKLDGNELTGEIPPELGDLDWLLELGLSGNAFTGCIPDSLRIHYYLAEELDLGFCAPTEASLPIAAGTEPTTSDQTPTMSILPWWRCSMITLPERRLRPRSGWPLAPRTFRGRPPWRHTSREAEEPLMASTSGWCPSELVPSLMSARTWLLPA